MTDSYQQTLESARAAINAGKKRQAMEQLRQAVEQNTTDPRPWLLMVYVAPSKQVAQQCLDQAVKRNAQALYLAQAQNWIDDFANNGLVEATPPVPKHLTRSIKWGKVSRKVVPLTYLGLLALAEALTAIWAPVWGLTLHGLCLVGLLLQASFTNDRLERPFLLSLSLTPLIRLVSLTLPLPMFPQVYWYAVVGIPLFLATYLMIRATGMKAKQFGLNARSIPTQILIAFIGILLGYIEYLILRPDPLITELRFDLIIIPALILLVFTGLLEELIFRGVFQYFAVRYIGRWGIYYSALIFAVFHLGYRSVEDFIFVFAVALLFSYIVHKTGSIVGVSVAHGLTNIGLYLLFPFILS